MEDANKKIFREPLKSGQIITLKRSDGKISEEFEIISEFGCGSSCLVYQAVLLENGVRSRPILLKEFYPITFSTLMERNKFSGELIFKANEQPNIFQEFENAKNRFIESCEKQKNFYLTHIFNADNLVEVQALYVLGASLYIVNPAVGGTVWNKIENESLNQILEITISVLQELSIYHNSGLLHGDIKPENIYVSPRQKVILLDFDSVQTLKDGSLTGLETLSYTNNYVAPEIFDAVECDELDRSDYYSCITAKSDLYSVAAVLYKKITGNFVPRNKKSVAENLRANELSDFWKRERLNKLKYISIRVKAELIRFFNVMLAVNPDDRFDIVEMLQQLIKILNMAAVPKLSLAASCKINTEPEYFIGRQKDLEQLRQLLESNSHIFVFGEGGLGKSTLVLKLAWNLREEYDFYYTAFTYDIEQTVARLPVEPADYEEKDIKIIYARHLKCLKSYGESSILIIDNFDMTPEKVAEQLHSKFYSDLMSLNMKVIFTCRRRPENFGTFFKIAELSDSELLELMHKNYQGADSENILVELIEQANRNTLVVEQMAKTLEQSWGELTPKKLLQLIQSKSTGSYEEKIYSCIRTLFDISVLSEKAKEIMARTILFPSAGINAAIFLRCHEETQVDKIRLLEMSGWLKKTPDNLLKVHSLIKSVCAKEISQKGAACKSFLERYAVEFDKLDKENWMAQRFQRVEIFSNAADELEDTEGLYSEKAGDLNYNEGFYSAALRYYEKRRVIFWQKNPTPAPLEALEIFYKIANSAYGMSQYKYAIYCAHSVLKLAERELGTNCPALFQYYVDLGNIYRIYEDLDNAKKCYETALKLRAPNGADDSIEIAQLYLNLTKLYLRLGDNSAAEKYGNMTMEILSQHRNFPLLLASLLESFAQLSKRAGDYYGELEYSKQAISIYETVLGKEHPRTAVSYNNKANALLNLEKYDEAADCLRAALSILEYNYGAVHNFTAKTYYNLARVYQKKGDFQQAFFWCQKTLDSHIQIFGEFHPITLFTSRTLWLELKKLENPILS